MPYPLSKLAYGLQCRLNELATPIERYKLQVAAGDGSICPPMQLVQNVNIYSPKFLLENGVVTIAKNYIALPNITKLLYGENKLTTCGPYVLLEDLSFQDLRSKIFDHTLFENGDFSLLSCSLSKQFYTMLRRTCPIVQQISVYKNTNASYKFNLTDLFDSFPNLEKLDIHCCTNNKWIPEILRSNNRSPLSLTLMFDPIPDAKFEKFDFVDLLTLLKTQETGFYIFIRVVSTRGEFAAYFSELKQFLDKNLVRGRKENRTAICISHGTGLSDLEYRTFHLPLNNEM